MDDIVATEHADGGRIQHWYRASWWNCSQILGRSMGSATDHVLHWVKQILQNVRCLDSHDNGIVKM